MIFFCLVFRGVVVLDIDLNKTSVNQCDSSTTMFAGSHKCRPETTQVRLQWLEHQYDSSTSMFAGSHKCRPKTTSNVRCILYNLLTKSSPSNLLLLKYIKMLLLTCAKYHQINSAC